MGVGLVCALVDGRRLSVPAHAAPADPDPTDYVLTTWTTKDGLPSDVITAIGQDDEGYLWLGTNGGLVRFDGTRFGSWDTLSTERLPRAPIRSLAVARDGSVWMGFAESGPVQRDARLEFRIEAFNVLNTPQFANPGTAVGTGTFGRITATSAPGRIMQLGLKYMF